MKNTLLILVALLTTACVPSDMRKTKMDYLCRGSGGVYSYGDNVRPGRCNTGLLIQPEEVQTLILPVEYAVKPEGVEK